MKDKIGSLFTLNGKDVWRLISYCEHPTATFQNLENGQTRGGAVGSRNLSGFVELKPDGALKEIPPAAVAYQVQPGGDEQSDYRIKKPKGFEEA